MLQCKNCGEFSEDGSSFCEHCGGSFEVIDNRNKSTKSVGVYSFLALIVVMLLTWGVTVSHKRTVISNATDIADKEYAEYQLSECFFIKGDNRIYTCIDVQFLDKSISVGQPVAYGIKDNNAIVKLKRIDDGMNSFSLNDQSDEYLNGIRNCFAMDSLDDYDYLVLKFDGVYMRLANMSVGEYFDYIHYIQDGNTSEESIAFIKENWSSDAKYNFTKELEEQLDALEALDDLGNVETWEDLYDWIEEYGEY